MTTHVVVRITSDQLAITTKHAAYGPVSKAEAFTIMDASYKLLQALHLSPSWVVGEGITARRSGSSIIWRLVCIELEPADDVCEGIS